MTKHKKATTDYVTHNDVWVDSIIQHSLTEPLSTLSPEARRKLKDVLKYIDTFEEGVEKCQKCAFVEVASDKHPCNTCFFNDGPLNNFKVPVKKD